MKLLKMKKEDMRAFLNGIMDIGEIYAPANRDGRGWRYERVKDAGEIDLMPGKPIIPLKYFFHPPRFHPLHFDVSGYHDLDDVDKRIIFGVHPCDINGTLILDRLFVEGPYKDSHYARRRENTYVIGLSCMPDEYCFCKSTNTHVATEGFDIFFNDLGDKYLVWVGTSRGYDLVHKCEELFTDNITREDIDDYARWHKVRDESFKTNFDLTAIPDKMELNYNAEFWEVLGDKCLSCGQCTMVCPTCNCFNVVDLLDLGPEQGGRRRRHWDSCMFEYYSIVSGGVNFRAKKSERVRLWYMHKLKGFNGKYGKYACVGCGRCIETCPVDINIKTVWEYVNGLRSKDESPSNEDKASVHISAEEATGGGV